MKYTALLFIASLSYLAATSVSICPAAPIAGLGLSGNTTCAPESDSQSGKAVDDSKKSAAKTDDDKKRNSTDLTVAILDFDSSAGDPKLGKEVSEVLALTLSGEPGFTVVERPTLARTLQEHELNLSGLVKKEQAIQIGKLVGARILVTGKIFLEGKTLFFTAKLIGTETSLLRGVIVTGDKDAEVGDLMTKLSAGVAAKLREAGPDLVAQPDAGKDPLPDLKKLFAGKKLPVISIHADERHVTTAPAARTDPAVDTELHGLFQDCGFKIVDGDAAQQADGGVTLVVSAEGFSEFSAKIGNLVSCAARVEVKITDRKTGEVLFSDRETTRAVDLAENIAGKTALQKAGRIVGLRLLQHLADSAGEKPKKPAH